MKLFSFRSSGSVSAPPPTFIGLVFALSGWALTGTALLQLHVGLRSHLIPALIGLYLVASSIRRMRPSRQPSSGDADFPAPPPGSSTLAMTGWALLLLLAGAFAGALILGGSATLLGLAAVGLTYAPWSRIPFCRDRTAVASIVMCVGIGLPLLAFHQATDPIFLLIAGLVFWLCATVAILGRIVGLRRVERDIKAAGRAASTQQT